MSQTSFIPEPNAIVIEISSGSESEHEEEEVLAPIPTKRLTRSVRTSTKRRPADDSRIDKRKKRSEPDEQAPAPNNKDPPASIAERRATKDTTISSSKPSKKPIKKSVVIAEERTDEDFIPNKEELISLAATALHQTRSHDTDKKEGSEVIAKSKNKEKENEAISKTKSKKADVTISPQLRRSSRHNKAADELVKNHVKEPVKEPVKESVKMPIKESVKESVKKPIKSPIKEKKITTNTRRRRASFGGKEASSEIPAAKTNKPISRTNDKENSNEMNKSKQVTEEQKRESVRNFLLKELSKFGKDQKRIKSIASDIEDEIHKNFEGEAYKSQFRRAITALRNHEAGFGRHLYSLSLQARDFAKMDPNDMVSQAQKLSAKELKEAELRKIMLNPISNRDLNEMKRTSIKLESYMVSTGISLDEDDYVNG